MKLKERTNKKKKETQIIIITVCWVSLSNVGLKEELQRVEHREIQAGAGEELSSTSLINFYKL